MARCLHVIAVLLFLFGIAHGQTDLPSATVCELTKSPARYNGRQVRLVATVLVEHERARLEHDGCQIAFEFADNVEAHVRFKALKDQNWYCFHALVDAPLDDRSLCADCRKFSVSAEFTGEVQSAGQGERGFGHHDLARVRLVVRSVSNVRAKERQLGM